MLEETKNKLEGNSSPENLMDGTVSSTAVTSGEIGEDTNSKVYIIFLFFFFSVILKVNTKRNNMNVGIIHRSKNNLTMNIK